MRVLGLDVGDRRIGVAVSDPTGLLASAHSVVERVGVRRDAERIAGIARDVEAERIVVGLPRRLDGELGEQAEKVQRFVRELASVLPLPIDYWDERLTSVEANRVMQAAGVRSRQRRGTVDAVAASLILQGYLDRWRAGGLHAADLGHAAIAAGELPRSARGSDTDQPGEP